MAAGGPTRQDTYSVGVQINHPVSGARIDYGVWDKLSGGALSAESTSYTPGGMAPPVSLGGRKSTGNITVSRLYRLGRDHDVVQQLFNSIGKDMVVHKQPLNLEGTKYGDPIVYHGTLIRVSPPDVDSEASGAGLIELEMAIEGYPSA